VGRPRPRRPRQQRAPALPAARAGPASSARRPPPAARAGPRQQRAPGEAGGPVVPCAPRRARMSVRGCLPWFLTGPVRVHTGPPHRCEWRVRLRGQASAWPLLADLVLAGLAPARRAVRPALPGARCRSAAV